MPLLRRSKPYDRKALLAQATRARQKGKVRKAIDLYGKILAVEPENAELHRRIAPLLATNRQSDEAWRSYQKAVENLAKAGFLEQAAGVLREACERLPREPQTWQRLADIQQERHRPMDALKVLLEGRRHFRRRKDRGQAIALLRRARKLAPNDFTTNHDRAGLLAREGARQPALRILEELAAVLHGSQLRRVRGRQLALSPSPGLAWLWLRAAVVGR
jgi:tetratricopeptide (TPR) repeat protein